jgi:hypothetical protein
MRRFKEPAIVQFGGAERLLCLRLVINHDPVSMFAAHDSVPAHFISPEKFGFYKNQKPLGVKCRIFYIP